MKQLLDINIVTHCVADLESEVAAWTDLLGYRVVERGRLSAALCGVWDTPAEEGLAYVLLQPESGADVFVRCIETGPREGYWMPVTWGWNATEILVKDPDDLAARLDNSAFRRFGGPGDLYPTPKAPRAIQTFGPAGTMIYFTRILPGGSRYGLHGAKSYVDRVFNMIVGGPSLETLASFYGDTLGLRVSDPMPFTMTMAAKATGAPPDQLFPICVAPVRARNSILELDEYPETTQPRARETGCLPGGISMVSFRVRDLERFPVALRAAPAVIDTQPYAGRRVAVAEGPAGEWLELIED